MKRWLPIFVGFTLLLAGSYIDNIRGVLLPVLTNVLSLKYSQSSLMLVLGNFASVVFTVGLLWLIQNFSENGILKSLFVLGIFSAVFSFWVTNFSSFLILSICFGAIVSLFGGMSNLLVIRGTTRENRARVMCGLHSMYGLGSVFAPITASGFIDKGYSWQWPVLGVLPLCFLLLILILFLGKGDTAPPTVREPSRLGKQHILILVTFAFYVAGECLACMWMPTFLIEHWKLSLTEAAPYLSGFFAMMIVTRSICFFSLKPAIEATVLILCLLASATFFFIGYNGVFLALAAVGILGPFFPLFLSRVGHAFPEQTRSLTLWILAVDQLTLSVLHLVLGRLTDSWGIKVAYAVPGFLLALSIPLLLFYLRIEKKAVESTR
jgi:MFS transporter, FHS family, glucose/mannose:H+ symporter